MICAKNNPAFRYPSQRGVALIVALILLLIMSILGIYGIRTTVLEEKMTAASYDRSLAFQAAEAALREGEAVARAQAAVGNNGFPNRGCNPNDCFWTMTPCPCKPSPCNNGLCAEHYPHCTHRWLDPNFNGWVNATNVSLLAGTPQYFVECLSCERQQTCSSRYRITARSNLGTGRAVVMVQSIYDANTKRRISWREIKQ